MVVGGEGKMRGMIDKSYIAPRATLAFLMLFVTENMLQYKYEKNIAFVFHSLNNHI